jgi:hypothetical protein
LGVEGVNGAGGGTQKLIEGDETKKKVGLRIVGKKKGLTYSHMGM